ncbi:MAG: RNA pseudouridine synthase [Oscillatoriales cyanobacterium]|nr:MAG: RNA pseudouridine synthase [Oscillatoriales cyanobacterium]
MNSGWIYRDRIDRTSEGQTALAYYSQRYPHSSEEEWRDRLVAGQILCDGAPVDPAWVLRRGQQLAYHRPPWVEPAVPLNFAVHYEDAAVLVVEKPSGLPVMPAGGFLRHTLLGQLQHRYPQETPVPIHRLGRGTSGLVLLARSTRARSALTQQMRDRQLHKVYLALASGGHAPDRFTIEQPIGKLAHPTLGYLYAATDDGAFARSDCRVLRRSGDRMLIEVTILTGRPHQIRIHLAAAGFPLLGDPLYGLGGVPRAVIDSELINPESTNPESTNPERSGRSALPGDCGYWLHAQTLGFHHPLTGEFRSITAAPLPEFAGELPNSARPITL